MTRKRTTIEIYLDVLRTVKNGVNKPTNIMYRCNLAWRPFRHVLDSLVENELLEIRWKGRRRTYHLTEKGYKVLRRFEDTQSLLLTLMKQR
ncbi:hypothetical protein CW706_00175 [Candidatus Bathyarchaeota archaeon]|nr:MAG: hypothetical protein CW706_00175 [Candidatus Bathyarchaeota archaeon]